ncbi:efflux RND transporter periplasmic adaptor subunit [Alteromonas ponticola]|uniref:Efflux RND transporter periplasmic adaptor subunit n=1 Tax=Alteromonas ponticola TaxID=2720613 RepID=A0ABX1R067_9ALTE|nr:efflux RND transporter periplasmic adaptor subunit [Alteromonas ponticola]NMH59454.1 efflux RND transporter periplasmic adaptor subunit [Alteromonas ponticola]
MTIPLNLKIARTLIATLFISGSACAQWSGENKAKLVVTEAIKFEYENKKVEAVGTAEAFRSVTLYPAVDDEVTEVNFAPGDEVKKGDVLLRLDDRRQQVALKRAKLELSDAERSLKRLQQSRKQGAVPQSDLDDAQTIFELAQVSVMEAQTELDDRQMLAPFSGIVGLTDVEVGDRITQQTAVTTLDDRSKLYINFKAPEAAVSLLLGSPEVQLQPWSERSTSLSAQIAQIDSRIDEVDRTMRARALLENVNDRFRPGMSFRVNLSVNGNLYAAVPEAALLWGATGAYLFKDNNGKAMKTNVTVHQRLRGTILVSGNLSEGDQLVVEGVQRLRHNQEIETQSARAQAKAQPDA